MDLADLLRLEIIVQSVAHLFLVYGTVIVMIALTVTSQLTGNPKPLVWVPFLGISVFGLLARGDVLIHRIAAALLKNGDTWEIAKAANPDIRYLIPVSDGFALAITLALVVYAEVEVFRYFVFRYFEREYLASWTYLTATVILLASAIAWWANASGLARKGF